MRNVLKEFLRFALMPAVLLGISLVFVIAWRFLDLPSSEEIVDIAKRYYTQYGYWVVLIGAFIEGVLFVTWYFPGSIIIAFGVIFARNVFEVIAVIGFVILGFLLSAMLNYAMGRFGWYSLFLLLGLREPLEKMKARMERIGLPLILSTYFHPMLGTLTATSAGILSLPFSSFLIYSTGALIFWDTLLGTIIYVMGPAVLYLLGENFFLFMIGALMVWIVFLAVKFFKNKSFSL